jgi:RHS repeat-associated protein
MILNSSAPPRRNSQARRQASRTKRPEVEAMERRILLSSGLGESTGHPLLAGRPDHLTAGSHAVATPKAVNASHEVRAKTDQAERNYLVPGTPGTTIRARFVLEARNTPLHDEFGIFLIDDPSGRIGKLYPGNRGYAVAALARRQIVFTPNQDAGAVTTLDLPAGQYFGTYLIQNGTSPQFLLRNRANQCQLAPKAFFSFPAANPLHHVHAVVKGLGLVGWEDRTHARAHHFDDEVVQMPGDGEPPIVTISTPPQGVVTRTNSIVAGTVSDDLSGVKSVQGRLDTGSPFDVAFNATGHFHFDTNLPIDGSADGRHVVSIRATDRAGNVSFPVAVSFVLDTTPPVIAITSPSSSQLQNTNLTVKGTVTDNLSSVAALTASVDGQSAVPVFFGPAGAFQFTTALALNGAMDGSHSITFQAADKAGNSAFPAHVSFVLDTTAPVVTVTHPTGSPVTDPNLTVAGRVTDNLAGIKALQGQLDSGGFFPVLFDASGNFNLRTTLPLDGSAGGLHTVQLAATDKAGNSSAVTAITFSLDTIPPTVSFDLDPSTDSAPVGDGQTTFDTVTLTGQTEPNLPVKLVEIGATTTADGTGQFHFPGVALALGSNSFHVQATDVAGNIGTATRSFTRIASACVFNDLTGWTTSEPGGSASGHGTVTVQGDRVVLREGDSFLVALERTFVIPAGATSLSFTYADLSFDTTDTNSIKDAFEASLLDSSGQTLVHTIGAGRDAFFNITEGQSPALGSEATLSGQIVTLDLAGVLAGTTATLVLRLVNNDSDHNTSIAITCVQCTTGSGSVLPLAAPTSKSVVTGGVAAAAPAAAVVWVDSAGHGAVSPPAIGQATVGTASGASVAAAGEPTAMAGYADLPMSFEPNQGQTDASVKFLSRGSGYTLFLPASEAVMSLVDSGSGDADNSGSSPSARSSVLRTQLVGANPSPDVVGLDSLPGASNYFTGSDSSQWRTDVPNYARVQYQNVYPGVDLIYHGQGRQLEYDFTVAPHADPGVIALQFKGADSSEIDAQGNLVLHVGSNDLVEHAPVIYQDVGGVRQSVPGGYVELGEGEYGFTIGSYDPSQPLVIDPVLIYSTYLGGSGEDDARAIAVDASGNAYVSGITSSTDFPTLSPFQTINHGGSDVFVTKLNPAGSAVVFSTYLGGSADDAASGIAVDSAGNLYITGNVDSSNFPTTSGAFQTTFGGMGGGPWRFGDAFVAKLNPTGSALLYSTYLGGSMNEAATAIAIDASGDAYVTGPTRSTDFPTTPGAFQTVYGGGSLDAFVAELNPTGSALVYSTYFGGNSIEDPKRIVVDSSGATYVMGSTASTNFPTTPGAFQTHFGGGDGNIGGYSGEGDVFVTKFNATGSSLVYSTYLGGSLNEQGYGLAVDSSGNAYVTGGTRSTDYPTVDAFQPASAGDSDAFVTKINAYGTGLVYSSYRGGSGTDIGYGIAVDKAGNAYIAGVTSSTNFPTAHPVQSALRGARDVFVTEFNATGVALKYSTYLGGSNAEEDYYVSAGYGIAVDGSRNAYIVGETPSPDFPTVNAVQPSFGGRGTFTGDAFVVKIGEPYAVQVSASAPGVQFLAGLKVLISGRASSVSSDGNTTRAIASVSVNGAPVDALDASGNFFASVPVAPGQTKYDVVATDVGGATGSASLTLEGVTAATGPIDFSLFSDVSASFTGDYARTSFNEDTKVLYADLRVRNAGSYPADAPLIVGIKNISDPTVRAVGFDGVMPDGTPYFDFTKRMAGKTLAPGGTTDYQSLAFLDPNRSQFTYDLVFLGNLNQPPAITSVPVVDAVADKTYTYHATANDPDGDRLTFSLTTAPLAMQVNPSSGQLTWSPTSDDLGTHDVTLRVDDGRGGFATQSYVISVTNPPPNRPPYFTSVPVVDANVNTAYAYHATAVDPDGDALTFALTSGLAGMHIDPQSGLVSWVPNSDQLGPQHVSLSVDDGHGGSATQSFTILVQQEPGNHPPVIVSEPVTTAVEGQPYTYAVTAIDPDNDTLAYSTATEPQGMTIDPVTGLISWTAAFVDVGQHGVTVRVEDGRGGFDTQSYAIDVAPLPPEQAGEIHGNVFNDLNADGVRDVAPMLLVSGGEIKRYNAANGAFVDSFLSGGDLQIGEEFAFGPDGDLYVGDWKTARILRYDGTAGQFIGVVAADPRLQYVGSSIIFGLDGNLLVTNSNQNLPVMRFNRVTGQYMGDFIPLGSGGLVAAGDMAFGPDGDLYVASVRGDDRILRFDGTSGQFIDAFIKLPPNRSDQMSNWGPQTIAFGPDGDVYLSDQGPIPPPGGGNCVMRFDGKTGAYKGDFIPPRSGGLYSAGGLAWADGKLYVASRYSGEVLRYDATNGFFIDRFIAAGSGGPGGPEDLQFASMLEPNLSGWTVYLDDNHNGRRDVGERFTTTDPQGAYAFTGLAPGSYVVAEEIQPRWVQTFPTTGTYTVDLAAGQVVTRVDLGDQQLTPEATGEIRGTLFKDLDDSGTFDPNETLQDAGRQFIYLDLNENGARDANEPFQLASDVPGEGGPSFVFANLLPGTYTVALESQSGWRQTTVGGVVITPPLFGIGNGLGSGSSELYRIDDYATSPRAVAVGDTGVQLGDIAVDPNSGRAFGLADAALYSVDLQTGAAKFIGPTGVSSLRALAFSPGTLYAMGSDNRNLYRVDPATGAATALFDTGYSTAGDLAFDADGSLYLTTGSDLVRIDVARSSATLIGGHGAGGMVGLGLDYTGRLIGLRWSDTDRTAQVYSISKTTGVATLIGNVTGAGSFGAEGLSFDVPRIVRDPDRRTYQVTITGNEVVLGANFGVLPDQTNNHPPSFASTAPTSAVVNQLLRYDAAATDPDGDFLTFALDVKPAGMAVSPTGTLVWIPTAQQVGTFDVILRVQDGRGGADLQSFTIKVTQANTPPAITSLPNGPAVVGALWVYQVKAQDAEGDPIAFSLGAHPDGMSIDPSTGLVSWTPGSTQVGSQHTEITASDNRGGSTTQSFDLPVVATAQNDPPQIKSTPRGSIRLGSTYLYQVVASDPNGDPITFSMPTSPVGMIVDPTTGLVSWKPTADQLGANPVQVRVDDDRGGYVTQTFSINVVSQSINHPPSITSNPPQAATVGKLYAYDLQGSDPDNDSLVWSLDASPTGMSIDPNLGTLRWTPTADQLGSQSVVVRASDPYGGFATQSYTVTVRSVNLPPMITSVPPTAADTADTYTYAVSASDPENDALTFSLTAFPASMTIDPNDGFIQWSPDASQVGSQNVAIQVDDGQGGIATQTYTIVVAYAATNQPPVITSTPSQVTTVGQTYTYQVTASDPEGQALTYMLLVKPDGMAIDPNTGLVTWTPTSAQIGSNAVVVGAVDPLGAGGTQSFGILVNPVNNPPALDPIADQSVTAGLQFRYDVHASDPDGNALYYSLDTASETRGMIIDGLGRMGWITTKDNVGSYPVTVTVTDALGATASQSFTLKVNADTQAPVVNLVISPNPINVGQPATIVAQATDDVGVVSRALTVNGVAVPIDSQGRATVLKLIGGQYTVVATATDDAGNVGSDTKTLVIIGNSDQNPPTVEITTPADGDTITQPVDVIGTASDDNLVSYTLSVAPVGSESFTQLAAGKTCVTNGVLGKFDPTGLANGAYDLRLEATDSGGNVSTIDETVNVAGDLKIGNFTLSFTDLSIPVSGIPVTLTRTYDSLNASHQDELGYGWRLEYRDTDLRTSVRPTTPEEQEAGIYNAYRTGSKVYITMPGGKREGFTFEPRLKNGFAGSVFGFADPVFVPDRGVTSSLTVNGATLMQADDGSWLGQVNGGELAYNPADPNWGGAFYLTTKDGLAYAVDANTGELNSVGDANGNALSFTDTSIDSNQGVHITFDLDPQGRVIAAHDPMGNTVKYQYDASGDLAAVTDRSGNITQFVYDAPGHPHYLTQVIDPLGRTGVRTKYDDQGRLISVIDADGNTVQLAHNPADSIETVTDALGNPTTFEYDPFGNVVREVDANGKTTLRTYDDANNMTSETDPLGHTTAYTYDGDGNVLTTTDALGNVTRNTYITLSPGGLIARVQGARPVTLLASTTDPLGNTTKDSYDGAGNLIATTDAAGNVTKYTYDGSGNQTSITDPAGNETIFTYDGAGRLLSQTDALGHTTSYTYDANGDQLTQTTMLTTPSGVRTLVTTTAYDASGRPISVTDAEGNTTKTEYDADGHQTATIDALNHKTSFVYDDRGQLIETDFPDANRTATTYDAYGHRITSKDQAGRTTTYQYDALGRLFETDNPGGTKTTTSYDAAGQVTAQTDELGNRTTFQYDAAGRQTVVTDALGNATTTTYDATGRRVATTDALGHTTSFVYDALGRLVETDYADGTKTTTTYDALGRAIAQTDQLSRTTQDQYDALGRLTAVVDALNQTTSYAYDEAGDLITQTDANGHVTKYEYDGLYRRIATVLPLGQRSTTTYDAAGNVASTTDFNGQTITDDYDVSNRLIAQHFPDGSSVTYKYTATGQRASYMDARGTTTYAYDTRDRLLSRTDSDSTKICYTYDAAGNRTSVAIPAGTTTYTFDVLNRTATVTDPEGGVTKYRYDADGNLVETDFPNGTTEKRQYDAVNHLTYVENAGPTGIISSYKYTLAKTGRRDAVLEDTGRTVQYQYDLLDRLIEEFITDANGTTRKTDYTYDPAGNRQSMVDSAQGETDYVYDANDRLLTETTGGVVTKYTYDNNGNTLSKFTSAVDQALYDWDAQNRMVGAKVIDSKGTSNIAYHYDADGIRVASVVDGSETRYLIDTVQPYAEVLEEYTPGGVIKVSYVYGRDLVSQNRGGAKSFYGVDGLGSIRVLTNGSGLVTDRYIYDAFGRTIAQVGSTGNGYLFAGEQRDGNVGLDYLRARYYASHLGRFFSADLFSGHTDSPISLHKYQYGNLNPVLNTDPTGYFTLTEAVVTVGILSILQSTAAFAAQSLLYSDTLGGRHPYIKWEGDIVVGGISFGGFVGPAAGIISMIVKPVNEINPTNQLVSQQWNLYGLGGSIGIPWLPISVSATTVTLFTPRFVGTGPGALSGFFAWGGIGIVPGKSLVSGSYFTAGFGVGYTSFASTTIGVDFSSEVLTGISIPD